MEVEVIDLPDLEVQNSKGLELRVDWNIAAQKVEVRHVNQVVVQIVEHELNLTFFQFNPPVVIAKNAEEALDQLRGTDSIIPDCAARINISSRTAKGLIEALQKQFDENGNLKGDQDGPEG